MTSDIFIEQVHAFSEEHKLFTKGSIVIVGLSGGPDSVALLSVLKQLQPEYHYTLIAAHLDHQWRANSHEDVVFCEKFATSLNVMFISATADQITPLKQPSGSQEDQGRQLRRSYFEQLAKQYGAQTIALGHHYNDQQETFFLRMIRGASIAGLAGMKPKSHMYVRPLLACSKAQILDYLKNNSLPYLKDETNTDTKYLRNAIRLKVIPALRECDPRFDASFAKMLTSIQETDAYLERVIEATFKELTEDITGNIALSVEGFLRTDEFLKPRLLVRWLCKAGVPFTPSTRFFEELMRFIKNPASEHQMHPSWKICKDKNNLTIEITQGK